MRKEKMMSVKLIGDRIEVTSTDGFFSEIPLRYADGWLVYDNPERFTVRDKQKALALSKTLGKQLAVHIPGKNDE